MKVGGNAGDVVGGDVDDGHNVIVGKANRQTDHSNKVNIDLSDHYAPTLEKRVERLERATFGDDAIGLYGIIRQQQKQTLWLQILTASILASEIIKYILL